MPSYDLVGCGAVMQAVHVPVLKFLQQGPELQIAACYDRDPDLARRVAGMLGTERWGTEVSPREDDGVDAAVVATPPSSHAAIAEQYAQAGKSAFVEKPLTSTAKEAKGLVDQSAARGVRVAVNQFWRFSPSMETARMLLRDQLGEVRSVEASEGSRWDWSPASDYVVEDPWGGVIHDTGAHLIDAVLYLLGLDSREDAVPVEIEGVRKLPSREPSHECRARLELGISSSQNVEVDLAMSRLRPVARGIKVRGSFGVLFVPAGFAPAPVLFRGSTGFRLRPAATAPEPIDLGGCFLLAHKEFLAALRDPRVAMRIDARRFLLLSRILETLHDNGGR